VFHLGKLLTLPTNIKLGWRGLPETNTLKSSMTEVKSFITLGPGWGCSRWKVERRRSFWRRRGDEEIGDVVRLRLVIEAVGTVVVLGRLENGKGPAEVGGLLRFPDPESCRKKI